MLNEDDPLALSELRNSGDAFNILAAAAAKTSPVRRLPTISPLSNISDQIMVLLHGPPRHMGI
jgi:hypothetical protein